MSTGMDQNITMNNKKVSVIIPVYNVEKYIGETIESVINQTYRNIEIITVNDGSTDGSLSILQEYAGKDSRIHIVDQKNKGLSGARNSGLAAATGEYLCIFDADDIMLPEKIATQVAYLEEYSDIDFVYSNIIHFIDGEKTERVLSIPKISKNPYKELLCGNFINPNSILMRKEVYERYGGFDESLRSAEDWDYWLKLAKNGVAFGHQDAFLTRYRVRNTSLSMDSVTMYETALRVLEKQKQEISPEFQPILNKQIKKRELRLGVAYLKSGAREQAYQFLQKSLVGKMFYYGNVIIPQKLLQNIYLLVRRLKFFINSNRYE